MLNYAVYDCGYELNEYYRLLQNLHTVSVFFGDPFVLVECQGQLAIRVMDVPDDEIVAPDIILKKP